MPKKEFFDGAADEGREFLKTITKVDPDIIDDEEINPDENIITWLEEMDYEWSGHSWVVAKPRIKYEFYQLADQQDIKPIRAESAEVAALLFAKHLHGARVRKVSYYGPSIDGSLNFGWVDRQGRTGRQFSICIIGGVDG